MRSCPTFPFSFMTNRNGRAGNRVRNFARASSAPRSGLRPSSSILVKYQAIFVGCIERSELRRVLKFELALRSIAGAPFTPLLNPAYDRLRFRSSLSGFDRLLHPRCGPKRCGFRILCSNNLANSLINIAYPKPALLASDVYHDPK